MTIAEISDLALKFLNDFAISPVPTAVFILADETKDEAQLFKSYYEANLAWDNLLALGLIEDVRVEKGKWLDNLEERTGRQFRIFQLTEHGRMMNGPLATEWVN
jgi:hypothetical protein